MTPQLDETAHQMEMRWGVDRLIRLVSPETAARFTHWQDKLNAALEHGGGNVAELASIVERGWKAMDAEATARNAVPIKDRWKEYRRGNAIFAIADDEEAAHACSLVAQWERREVSVYLADALLDAALANPMLKAIHAAWPGALVTTPPAEHRQGRRRMDSGDDIPFPNPDEGEAA
jgi:hypothetical protein